MRQVDDLVAGLLQVVGMAEPIGGLAQQLVFRPAQDVAPGPADAQPYAVGVGDQERVLRQVPQPFAFGQLFGDLAFERLGHLRQAFQRHPLVLDIGIGADPAGDTARGAEDGQGAGNVPAINAIGAANAERRLVRGFAGSQRRGPGGGGRGDIVRMHDRPPSFAVEFAWLRATVGVDLVVEPIELAIRPGRPYLVGHGLGDGAQFGFARRQCRRGLGAVDQLPRALGDGLHEGDLIGRPGARGLRIEIDDGAQPPAAQEGHDQDGAGIGLAGGFQCPRFGLAQGIGEQVVDDDSLTTGQPRHDLLPEDVRRIVAEQGRHRTVGPADIIAEDVVLGVEQAIADA